MSNPDRASRVRSGEDEGMGAFAYAVVLVVIAAAGVAWWVVGWVQR